MGGRLSVLTTLPHSCALHRSHTACAERAAEAEAPYCPGGSERTLRRGMRSTMECTVQCIVQCIVECYMECAVECTVKCTMECTTAYLRSETCSIPLAWVLTAAESATFAGPHGRIAASNWALNGSAAPLERVAQPSA